MLEDRVLVQEDLFSVSRSTRQNVADFLGSEMANSASLYAVIDGHAGDACCNYLVDDIAKQFWRSSGKLLKEMDSAPSAQDWVSGVLHHMCLELDKNFMSVCPTGRRDGACANICVLWDNLLGSANVGDCRAMVCNTGGSLVELSVDQKPDREDEKARIEEAGGVVKNDRRSGIPRMNPGSLSMSRAFGNKPFKAHGHVIAVPEIKFHEVDGDALFLLLASDGVWGTMTSAEGAEVIHDYLINDGLTCHKASKGLVQEAKNRHTTDDVSVLVIDLR